MVVQVSLNLTVMERAEATQSRNVSILDKLFKAYHALKFLSVKSSRNPRATLTHIPHRLESSRRATYRQGTCRLGEHLALRLGHQDSS